MRFPVSGLWIDDDSIVIRLGTTNDPARRREVGYYASRRCAEALLHMARYMPGYDEEVAYVRILSMGEQEMAERLALALDKEGWTATIEN